MVIALYNHLHLAVKLHSGLKEEHPSTPSILHHEQLSGS